MVANIFLVGFYSFGEISSLFKFDVEHSLTIGIFERSQKSLVEMLGNSEWTTTFFKIKVGSDKTIKYNQVSVLQVLSEFLEKHF